MGPVASTGRTRWLSPSPCRSFLVGSFLSLSLGCSYLTPVHFHTENLPYPVLNAALDKVEDYASPPSRGFPPINKELLQLGRFRLSTAFRVRYSNPSDNNPEYEPGSHGAREGLRPRAKLRLNHDTLYFEVQFRF